ncbi:MAG: hypothetical protein IJA14_03925 [Alphaproteobacteria bacterium]|nr:hypothetical protein [Alphaproteobacteria bacterium]
MKKIMYEIAGIALLCSTCIGTVNAEPVNASLELEDLDDEGKDVNKVDEGKQEAKRKLKITKADGTEIIPTKKAESSKESEDGLTIEKPTSKKLNIVLAKDKESNTEEATETPAKSEVDDTSKKEDSEITDDTSKKEDSETTDETPKTEEPETKDETQKEETSDTEETRKMKALAGGLAGLADSVDAAKAVAGKVMDKAEEINTQKEETSDTEKTNEKTEDKALSDEEFVNQNAADMAELFGNDSSEQISNEQSGAVLPSISEKDLSRNIANEFDEALKSYLEQQKKLSGLKKDLSDQYKKLSQELSKLPEGSETQSRITEIHKSLTEAEDGLGKLKTALSELDKTWDEGQLDRSKFEEVWKNLDAQKKLLDDQVDVRSKLSNEIGQFASKLEGLKGTLTEIDKLLENFGVVKNALTEINKTDYSELFSVVNKQGPHKMLNEQQEWEKTRTLWENHKNAVIRAEAEEITEARKAHDNAMEELQGPTEKESKTLFDESAITGLSEIAEQARIELDVLELSKDDFIKSNVLNGTDWSSFAAKFDANKVEIPNNGKDLAGKIKSLLDDFIALKASIESQDATEVSEEDQHKGVEMMNKLKKYLSSLRKVGISSEDKSIIRQKRLAASAENLAELVDKAMKTINTSKLALKSLNKSFVDFASYEHEFDAKKETPEGQKKLVDDVKTKLTAFVSWFESIKKQNPSIVSKEDKKAGLVTAKDLANALSELIKNVKSTISEPKAEVSKTESDTEGKVDDSAA